MNMRALVTLLLIGPAATAVRADCTGAETVTQWLTALRKGGAETIREAYAYAAPESVCEVDALIAATRDHAPLVRRYAARALGDSSAASDRLVPALIRLLSDPDGAVRRQATLALGRQGAAAVPALAAQLQRVDAKAADGSNEHVSDYAALALVEIGAPAAEAVLAQIDLKNDQLRRTVEYTLRQIGAPAAPAVRAFAAKADNAELKLWAHTQALELDPASAEGCSAIVQSVAPPARDRHVLQVPAIREQVVAADASVAVPRPGRPTAARGAKRPAAVAVTSLASHVAPRCAALSPHLVSLMNAPDAQISFAARSRVAFSIASASPTVADAYLRDVATRTSGIARLDAFGAAVHRDELRRPVREIVVPVLRQSLAANDPAERVAAVELLASLGADSDSAIADLERALVDTSAAVRTTAIATIAALGPAARQAAPWLLPHMTQGDASTKSAAIAAFSRAAEPSEALAKFSELLSDADPVTATALARGLQSLGAVGFPALLGLARTSTDPQLRATAFQYAVAVDRESPQVRDVRGVLMRDPSPRVRAAAVAALPMRLNAQDAQMLGTMLRTDTDPLVRDAILSALRAAGRSGSAAAPSLRNLYEASRDDDVAMTWFIVSGDADALARVREVFTASTVTKPDSRFLLIREAADHVWPGLLPLLDNADVKTLVNVLNVLKKARGPVTEAVEPLRPLLQHPQAEVRAGAFEVLAKTGRGAEPARDQITLALTDPDVRVRDAAAAAYENIGGDDAAYHTVMQDRHAARYFAQKLPAVAGAARPGTTRVFYSISNQLPEFPLPPPQWTAYDVLDPATILGGQNDTLRDVHGRLSKALRALQYDQQSLFRVPGGFALATRMERIDDAGRPFPVPDRWTRERLQPRTISEYLEMLFMERPGRFRIFVFVVTSLQNLGNPRAAVFDDEQLVQFESSARLLPDDIGGLRFGGRHCHVLVYSFDKRPARVATIVREDPIGWSGHLDAAGLRSMFVR